MYVGIYLYFKYVIVKQQQQQNYIKIFKLLIILGILTFFFTIIIILICSLQFHICFLMSPVLVQWNQIEQYEAVLLVVLKIQLMYDVTRV